MAMTWRSRAFDLASGLFVPQLVTWDCQLATRPSFCGSV